MAYPISPSNPASGHPGAVTAYPNYSGVFIPEIWSTSVIANYYASTVLSQITNTDFEGEIRGMGDKVIIRTEPVVIDRPYQIGQLLQTDFPMGSTVELLIDKGRYWKTAIDDVVAKQQDIDQMQMWARSAGEQLKMSLDSEVLAYLPANVAAANTGATAGAVTHSLDLGTLTAALSLTSANVIDTLLKLGQALDEQNVPETGRFAVLPYWATRLLKQSDIKDASLTNDQASPLRNGRVGRIDRFDVYNSNLLPYNSSPGPTDWRSVILAGTKDAATFATQLTSMTPPREAENTFATYIRGLVVYGYKMIKPQAMAVAYIR